MSSSSADGPAVDDEGVRFVLADRYRRLSGVRLVQELGVADCSFTREGTRWSLRVDRPPVDRMEYLFEVEDASGHRVTITDPANPCRAPGVFGEKSVVEFPGYRRPAWLDAPRVTGTESALELDAPLLDSTVSGVLWAPAELSADGTAPLLVVHDGPEFASVGRFVDYLGASIASGALPPVRAALLGPRDRNVWYSAAPDYAETLATVVLPALPAASVRVGVGVSLGALAMLHAHRTYPASFDALFLQSGSFFTADLDPQEAHFSGFAAVTGFVASVHAAATDRRPVPTTITCGEAEENLANNRRMAATLTRLGYPTTTTTVRDAHNYTAWRDALHPPLTQLITSVAAHAA